MREGAALLHDDFARARELLSRRFASSGDWRLFRSMRALARLETYLRRPLRVAVMGEQSAGKSSLINALMRRDVVPAGALAGIRAYLLLRYGPEAALHAVGNDGSRARLTSRALARMAGPEMRGQPSGMTIYAAGEPARRDNLAGAGLLPQTPRPAGDSAMRLIEIIQPHALLRRADLVEGRGCPEEGAGKRILRHVLPVDLTVWCTLGTQAWKESERQSWRRLPAKLRRDAILLVTYKDALGSAKDEAKLIGRLERDAGPFFADIVLVSLRQAAEAIGPDGAIADEGRWRRSGLAAFETALDGRLADQENRRLARSLRFLTRLAARSGERGTVPAITSPVAEETARHFQCLMRRIEERHAMSQADAAPGAEPPALLRQETR